MTWGERRALEHRVRDPGKCQRPGQGREEIAAVGAAAAVVVPPPLSSPAGPAPYPQGSATPAAFLLFLNVKTACSWRGIVPFTHLTREGRMTVTIGRRELLAALGGAAALAPLAASAQEPGPHLS